MSDLTRRAFLTAAGTAALSSCTPSTPRQKSETPVTPATANELFSGRAYPPASEHQALRDRNRPMRAADDRPNILFLVTDQHALDALSCAGNNWVHTPYLDQLAKRSVSFRRSYCTSPICTPSRASLYTGLMPHQTGADYLNQPLKPGTRTIGERLSETGYDCTYIGKWHVPESYPKGSSDIPGFVHIPLPPLKNPHLGDITDFIHAQDAEYYLKYHAALSPKPWFLAVNLHNPHDICHYCVHPPAHHPGTLPLPPLPPNFEVADDEPEMLSWRRAQNNYAIEMPFTRDWKEADWRAYLYAYYRWVEAADRACGIVLDSLEKGGWLDNTIVVFTSDHGEGMAAHRWVTKLSLYEESMAVPTFVSGPGIARPSTTDREHLVSGADWVPTFLDYAKAPIDTTLPGTSLRPVLEARSGVSRSTLVSEIAVNKHELTWLGRILISGTYKFVAWSQGARSEQLFDLSADPGETRNLISDPSRQSDLSRLRSEMIAELSRTGDSFTWSPTMPAANT